MKLIICYIYFFKCYFHHVFIFLVIIYGKYIIYLLCNFFLNWSVHQFDLQDTRDFEIFVTTISQMDNCSREMANKLCWIYKPLRKVLYFNNSMKSYLICSYVVCISHSFITLLNDLYLFFFE